MTMGVLRSATSNQEDSIAKKHESPAATWLRDQRVSQRDLATCTGQSQTRVSFQMSGQKPMSSELAVALRTVIAANGLRGHQIDGEMARLRDLIIVGSEMLGHDRPREGISTMTTRKTNRSSNEKQSGGQ